MTDIDTAALRALAEAATPGPWSVTHTGPTNKTYRLLTRTGAPSMLLARIGGDPLYASESDALAAYIAAASTTTMLALLDRLAAVELERDAMAALLKEAREALRVRGSTMLIDRVALLDRIDAAINKEQGNG